MESSKGEYWLAHIRDGKPSRVCETAKEATRIGKQSGYEYCIAIVNAYSLRSN